MLKLNTAFMKKVPVDGTKFSSQSYHASIEVELSDGMTAEQVKARIHDTFNLVKQSVEEELNGKANNTGTVQPPAPQTAGKNNDESGRKASNGQINYITGLITKQNISLSTLNAEIQRRFKVDGLYDLSMKQAHELLDTLKTAKAA